MRLGRNAAETGQLTSPASRDRVYRDVHAGGAVVRHGRVCPRVRDVGQVQLGQGSIASNDLRFLMILNILMNQFFEEY